MSVIIPRIISSTSQINTEIQINKAIDWFKVDISKIDCSVEVWEVFWLGVNLGVEVGAEVDDAKIKINFDQISIVVLLPPVQAYPFSTFQVLDHPSFGVVFPSSHSSPESLTVLPHRSTHWGIPPVEIFDFPAGQVTVTLKEEFDI